MAIEDVHAAQIAMGSAAVKDARLRSRRCKRRASPVLDCACAHREELVDRVADAGLTSHGDLPLARIARSWLIGSQGLPDTTELVQAHHQARLVAPYKSIIRLA